MTNQQTLFQHDDEKKNSLVECLGISFKSDEERRTHFSDELRRKLPELRKVEGFPLGDDDDIIALSDPPYYTACPNPWIQDFITQWTKDKTNDAPYHREPFAADVSEGKNDPIYNAHSYHTKVPHKAIMRYILHYTEPGDVVFDGFCGTGMTGVAAQMCGNRSEVESLGYIVDEEGIIFDVDENGARFPFSKLGARRAVLNDLSPAATFIAYNYNTPVDVEAFEREAKRILDEVEVECGWMYETKHSKGGTGKINYTVWSDVFVCPHCVREIVFWDVAVDKTAGKVLDAFPCPGCNAELSKRTMQRAWTKHFDRLINENIRQAKQVPVLINYTFDKKRFEKLPDDDDISLINKIESSDIPYWVPTAELPDGYNTRQPKISHGITHVHHFYTKRNLWVLGAIRKQCSSKISLLWFNSQLINISKLNRYRPGISFPYNPLSGTLYVGSQISEASV